MDISKTPNPGSDEALDLGCLCPVMDNNHGQGSDWGYNKFWISESCPLHVKEEKKERK
jgi:hypothetical protein